MKLELRRQVLTTTFFADLAESHVDGEVALIIFDTHEDATDHVKDWLSSSFLPGGARARVGRRRSRGPDHARAQNRLG